MTQRPGTPQQERMGCVKGITGCLVLLVLLMFFMVAIQSCFSPSEKTEEKKPTTSTSESITEKDSESKDSKSSGLIIPFRSYLHGSVYSYYYDQRSWSIRVQAVVTNTENRPFVAKYAYLALSNEYGQVIANDLVFFEPPKILRPGESMPIYFRVFRSSDIQDVRQAVVKVYGWILY